MGGSHDFSIRFGLKKMEASKTREYQNFSRVLVPCNDWGASSEAKMKPEFGVSLTWYEQSLAHLEDLDMNRRKLLAAGVGLGTLGLISKASQAVSDDETDLKSDFTGPVYCPLYPYMFCGSYTLYYAVQNNEGVCGANPGSIAGPNGLVCGCPGPSCQPTLSIRGSKDARKKIVGDSTYIHQHLDKLGMKRLPNNKVNFAPGADPVGNPGGYLVKFTDNSGKERNARVFEVLIRKSKIDGDMLDLLGIDKNIIEDKTFYIGHEEVVESSDVFEDPAASGVWISDMTYQVIASIDGNLTEFLVVMKRP